MSSLFLKDFNWCGYNVGGIKNLYISDYYFYQQGYNLDNNGRISGFKTPAIWIDMDINLLVVDYTENKNQTFWDQTLAFGIDKLSYDKRTVIEGLRDRRIMIIFQDNNDKWWFLGENGLKLNSETDNINLTNNSSVLNFSTTSYCKMREVLEAVIPTLVVCTTCNCFQYWDELAESSTVDLVYIWDCIVNEFDTVNGVILP